MTNEAEVSESLKDAYKDDLDFRATYGTWKNNFGQIKASNCWKNIIIGDTWLKRWLGMWIHVTFVKFPRESTKYWQILTLTSTKGIVATNNYGLRVGCTANSMGQ